MVLAAIRLSKGVLHVCSWAWYTSKFKEALNFDVGMGAGAHMFVSKSPEKYNKQADK